MEDNEKIGEPKYIEAPDIDFSTLAKINEEIQKSFGIPLFGTIVDKDD